MNVTKGNFSCKQGSNNKIQRNKDKKLFYVPKLETGIDVSRL